MTFCNEQHHYPLNFDFDKKVSHLTLVGTKFQFSGMDEWTDLSELWTQHEQESACKSKELDKPKAKNVDDTKVEKKKVGKGWNRSAAVSGLVLAMRLVFGYQASKWWGVRIEGMSLPGGPAICPRPANWSGLSYASP